MAAKDAPLDEQQFKDPVALAEMGGVHENTVLFYFARSPFFDVTSNNAILFSQAMFNPKMYPVIQTRYAFESRLKTMSGLEFMIAQEPAEMAPGTGTGVWVIRKQIRKKKPMGEDEITVLGSYFVVGDHIYMAPALSDILGGRMLNIATSLNKFATTASTIPDFTPSLGRSYLPPPKKASKGTDALSQRSREATPLSDSPESKKASGTTQTNEQIYNKLLAQSISISMKYGDEYMDEAPITGQPGGFHLSTSTRKDNRLAVPPVNKGGPTAAKPTPRPTLKTDVPPAAAKKGSKSPKTPGGIPKPKRKKSKILNSAGGLSPS